MVEMINTDKLLAVFKTQHTGNNNRFWNWVLPLVVLLTAYGMQRSVALLGLDLHHDTLMFDAARRALNGEVPYRDFFYQYNFGTIFLHVLALKVFGTQIASLKIVTAFAYALIALLIYACVAIQGRLWWALGAALLWSTLSPFYMPAQNGYHTWSTVYMMTSVMGGALFLMMALQGRPLLWSILAGMSFNLAFWFKQVAGLQILFVLVWIIYNAFRPAVGLANARRFRIILWGYALGGLASTLPFILYLQEHSLFYEWWVSAFVFNGFFVVSGNSASGLVAFLRTLFPVARDMGYASFVWALLPLCLFAVVLVRDSDNGKRLLLRSDARSLGVSLFAALGIAGWVEYFPLAHAFHTQLFMAPVFVLLSVGLADITASVTITGRRILVPLLILTLGVAVYEAARHLCGLIIKTSRSAEELCWDGPTSGLKLEPTHAHSLENFQRALINAKRDAGEVPLIPMSVDPLRALLPDAYPEPTLFKMGLNWTWPNEIVEPGFNKLLAQRVEERRSPIYADSLIGIPGYIPVALLEMPSPITATHTLYIPSADQVVKEAQTVVISRILKTSNQILSESNRIYSTQRDSELDMDLFPPESLDWKLIENIYQLHAESNRVYSTQKDSELDMDLFPLESLDWKLIENIYQLHVSIVRAEDIPRKLSALQYEKFLMALQGDMPAKVAKLYRSKGQFQYLLNWPITHEQTLDLSKFMLSSGKLFEQQDRPLFFTTLSMQTDRQPFLVTMSESEDMPRIAWQRGVQMTPVRRGFRLFLAIPADVVPINEEAVLYVQVVMKDKSTHNLYLHYLPYEY